MPYVIRAANGHIDGAFACKQDFTTEFLADDDPEIIAFNKEAEDLAKGIRPSIPIANSGPTDIA